MIHEAVRFRSVLSSVLQELLPLALQAREIIQVHSSPCAPLWSVLSFFVSLYCSIPLKATGSFGGLCCVGIDSNVFRWNWGTCIWYLLCDRPCVCFSLGFSCLSFFLFLFIHFLHQSPFLLGSLCFFFLFKQSISVLLKIGAVISCTLYSCHRSGFYAGIRPLLQVQAFLRVPITFGQASVCVECHSTLSALCNSSLLCLKTATGWLLWCTAIESHQGERFSSGLYILGVPCNSWVRLLTAPQLHFSPTRSFIAPISCVQVSVSVSKHGWELS